MTATENNRLLPMELLEEVVPMIRAAAHPLRIRILDFLEQEGEPRTVSLITEACGMGQAFVSQQLRILKDQGTLSCQRQGNYVLYSIADPSILHLVHCIRSHQAARLGAASDGMPAGEKQS
jgi:DNA-binding transcriptional ArsR family regulator